MPTSIIVETISGTISSNATSMSLKNGARILSILYSFKYFKSFDMLFSSCFILHSIMVYNTLNNTMKTAFFQDAAAISRSLTETGSSDKLMRCRKETVW